MQRSMGEGRKAHTAHPYAVKPRLKTLLGEPVSGLVECAGQHATLFAAFALLHSVVFMSVNGTVRGPYMAREKQALGAQLPCQCTYVIYGVSAYFYFYFFLEGGLLNLNRKSVRVVRVEVIPNF